MKTIIPIAAVLVATTALTTSVYALDQAKTPDAMVRHDFGRLVKDGHQIMHDVRAARISIFNAKPDQARKDVTNAMQALEKAKTDDATFMKAEADLKPPANVKQLGDQSATPSKTPVSWLPVDGAMVINEDFTAVPDKVAAVKSANEHLKAGEKKAALDTLKVHDVNVGFAMEVVPMDATAKAVDQASQFIDQGKYYEANQALMNAETGIRYDVVDVNGVPQKNAAANANASTNTQTPPKSTTATPSAPKTNAPATTGK